MLIFRLLPLLLLLTGCQLDTLLPPLADEESPPIEGLVLQSTPQLGTFPPRPPVATNWRDPITGITLTRIPGGCFTMGDNQGKPPEQPAHTVCLQDFWLAIHETTQQQWQQIMGSVPIQTITQPELPVENVSWNETSHFLQRLNSASPGRFRLPTEAEWEFACRNRGKTRHFCGTDDDPTPYAWYNGGGGSLHPVGERLPNGLGLFDMNGNAWEWVADWFDEGYYAAAPANNPEGPETGSARVFRGGGVFSGPEFIRATHRANLWPDRKHSLLGFRVAGTPPDGE
ncbi:MAG: SUMF1/EgtB/PvdO family nonheme iron enzyme [Magnetococcales bacterium]|nr:SUMF1/EgtB/PvdO family nonheme iron enzyme [Magnetococcales bacterium]